MTKLLYKVRQLLQNTTAIPFYETNIDLMIVEGFLNKRVHSEHEQEELLETRLLL